MSQHDFTIDNQTFPATRSDINSALQALASLSSGASSPSTTFAYQLWVNTTADPNILNIRNSANNAWIKIGEVNQGSAAFILTAYAILQAGSAAAPSFSFDLDRDTGMYRAAANIIGFATNGTERFRVGDSGQLGIGGATYGTSGQVLTSGGASAAPSWATPATPSTAGQLLRAPQVLTSGTSYTTPAGCTAILVEALGGGGGGARVTTGTDALSGGGGGGYARKYFVVSPSTSYTYAIGAGGAGRTTNGAGNSGGNTTFTVGATTVTAGGATGGRIVGNTSAAGGTSTNGDLNISGSRSPTAVASDSNSRAGSNSMYGAGGRFSDSLNATGFGAGGAADVGAGSTSGSGSNGLIIISEYS